MTVHEIRTKILTCAAEVKIELEAHRANALETAHRVDARSTAPAVSKQTLVRICRE